MLGQDGLDLPRGGTFGIAAELIPDRPQIEYAHHLRLVERSLEPPPLQDVREVEKGAGDGRARDVVLDGDVGSGQICRAVDDQVAAPTRVLAGHRHLRLGTVVVEKSVEGRSRAMAHHGFWTV